MWLAFLQVACGDTWPRFRGPNGTGQAEVEIPLKWSETDILWRSELPGPGHSSPVIWGDRVFVTCSDSETSDQIIMGYDAFTGDVLWQKEFSSHPHRLHENNSFATSTPAVDEHRLYTTWVTSDTYVVAALDHAGQQMWRRDLGPFKGRHGFGASPIVAGDIVCVSNDNLGESFIAGLDSATGETRWRVERPSDDVSYATPCIVQTVTGNNLLIAQSKAAGMAALDVASGKTVWELQDALPERCISSPLWAGGLIIATCGKAGNGVRLLAIRPGDTAAETEEAYSLPPGVPYVPTPVVHGSLLFLWHERGTVACVDLSTGQQHWEERVGGNYFSSPICIGDRIYGISLDGEVVVLAADNEFRVLARNSLGEPTRATPAVAHGKLYLRTESSLICIGTR